MHNALVMHALQALHVEQEARAVSMISRFATPPMTLEHKQLCAIIAVLPAAVQHSSGLYHSWCCKRQFSVFILRHLRCSHAVLLGLGCTLSMAKPWLTMRGGLCVYACMSRDRRPVAGPSNCMTRKDSRENLLGPSMTFLVPA